MAEEKKKKAPHEILVQDLVGAEPGANAGMWIGKLYIPSPILWGLGAKLLSMTNLKKAKHKADALAALKKIQGHDRAKAFVVDNLIDEAIRALKKEAGKEKVEELGEI